MRRCPDFNVPEAEWEAWQGDVLRDHYSRILRQHVPPLSEADFQSALTVSVDAALAIYREDLERTIDHLLNGTPGATTPIGILAAHPEEGA